MELKTLNQWATRVHSSLPILHCKSASRTDLSLLISAHGFLLRKNTLCRMYSILRFYCQVKGECCPQRMAIVLVCWRKNHARSFKRLKQAVVVTVWYFQQTHDLLQCSLILPFMRKSYPSLWHLFTTRRLWDFYIFVKQPLNTESTGKSERKGRGRQLLKKF